MSRSKAIRRDLVRARRRRARRYVSGDTPCRLPPPWKPRVAFPAWGIVFLLPFILGGCLAMAEPMIWGPVGIAGMLFIVLPQMLSLLQVSDRLARERVTVLYRDAPAWEVGAGTIARIPGSHYGCDFGGKVISVEPPDHRWATRDVRDSARRLVTLDISRLDASRLRHGTLKVIGEGISAHLEAVTFADRHGQIAIGLRARWGSHAEAKEAEAVAHAESVTTSSTPLVDEEFDQEVIRLKRALPKMLVHSGAGLYEVGPSKTYSTIQSALDQLWTDQGAASFTASQYIRVFASTYAENVVPNISLLPDLDDGYALVIEGDPADNRGNIVVDPAASWALSIQCNGKVIVRHIKLGGATSLFTRYNWLAVRDCIMEPATGGGLNIYKYAPLVVEDTVIACQTADQAAIYLSTAGQDRVVRRCRLSAKYGIMVGYAGIANIEGCVFDIESVGAAAFFSTNEHYYYGITYRMVNCTVYGGTYGFQVGSADYYEVINCIFKDVAYPVGLRVPPEDSAIRNGTKVRLRNNCMHGHTGAALVAGASKTLTELEAYGNVDASGDIEQDPLLNDPGTDDFSLQTTSPCRGTGYGSGLTAYHDGAAADGQHPNIGAAGTASDPPAPIWGSGVSNIVATDALQNDRVGVVFDAAPIGGVGFTVEYGVQYRIGVGAWTDGWVGKDLSVSIADLVQDQAYEFRVGARCSEYEQSWVYPSDTDNATPTGATEPVKPTITKTVDDETGTSITLTLVADNPADVLTVRYRALDVEAWTVFGTTRTGSGELQVTGLNPSKWTFIATAARTGDNSLPSDPAIEWSTTGAPATGDLKSMPLLRRTPHVVILKRPAISRDTDNNVATRDYDSPTRTAQVKCLFQSRGGEVSIGDEGNIIPFDAKLYTLDKNVEVNDRIEVTLSFYTGNFLVTAVVPKGLLHGGYSHNEVLLQKDGVR